ncbi:hypothetical protein BDZ45DRAFT_765670 [Acephala macrosclerotiorum]|nr:hypothetical protein BDZ45DRAFT_765670 [Acephala macrosclerotiorum]
MEEDVSSYMEGFNPKIEELKNKMRNHKCLIQSQAGIVESEEIQKARKLVEVEFRNSRDADLDCRHSKVIQWLSPPSSETTQEGCKSVLASLAIEEARKLPEAVVVFFFCKPGDGSRNGFMAITRGILFQILSRNKSKDHMLYVDEKASFSGELVLASLKLAKELLETAIQSCKKTYIILDGLDECNRDERSVEMHSGT